MITRSSTALTHKAINTWLGPLRPVLDPAGTLDWPRLQALDTALDAALTGHPVGANLPPEPSAAADSKRSGENWPTTVTSTPPDGHRCSVCARSSCAATATSTCVTPPVDLRDTTGLGHGQLIARHGGRQARQRWIPRLLAGELAGIAVTEPHAAPVRPRPAPVPFPTRTAPGWSPAARPGSAG